MVRVVGVTAVAGPGVEDVPAAGQCRLVVGRVGGGSPQRQRGERSGQLSPAAGCLNHHASSEFAAGSDRPAFFVEHNALKLVLTLMEQ
jgi:hypothetical protein